MIWTVVPRVRFCGHSREGGPPGIIHAPGGGVEFYVLRPAISHKIHRLPGRQDEHPRLPGLERGELWVAGAWVKVIPSKIKKVMLPWNTPGLAGRRMLPSGSRAAGPSAESLAFG